MVTAVGNQHPPLRAFTMVCTTYITPQAQASYNYGKGVAQAKRHLGHTLHNTNPPTPRATRVNRWQRANPLFCHVRAAVVRGAFWVANG